MVQLSQPPSSLHAYTTVVPNAHKALGSTSPQPQPSVNHVRSFRLASIPSASHHTRAWAPIDGFRCEIIIDMTRARISLTSAALLKRGRTYKPCSAPDGKITSVGDNDLMIIGRVALEIRLVPLTIAAPFVVVGGVAFQELFGVDLLYTHEMAGGAQHQRVGPGPLAGDPVLKDGHGYDAMLEPFGGLLTLRSYL
ncbi:hypothetical protein Efla_004551 [Eimeria flavescens]